MISAILALLLTAARAVYIIRKFCGEKNGHTRCIESVVWRLFSCYV